MSMVADSSRTRPSLRVFLHAPLELVRPIAPATVILGTGGTRRRAILHGISPHSEDYAALTRQEMVACYDLVLRHGVQHLVTAMLTATHNEEATPGYRDRIIGWTKWALVGSEALADYARLGWRVRLIGTESWPELAPVAAQLLEATQAHTGPTVWYSVASRRDRTWAHILQIAVEQQCTDVASLITAVYGEPIPPATLYLGAGKPQIEDSLIPPLLAGKMECYWRQHLGYDLDEKTLRTILYDFAYIRPTWQADKTGRAEQVLGYADVWNEPAVLGLGTRLGPFWYPAPTAPATASKTAAATPEAQP